jgi:hypothetical protein
MFKKKLWEEIYVLCNELVRNLAKVRWYMDKKTREVDKWTFDPFPSGKSIMRIVACMLLNILIFLLMHH